MAKMSCSTSTPSVMRPGSVSSSRFSYNTLTMMTVEESAQAMVRYSASKPPPPSDSPMATKNSDAEHAGADQLAAGGKQDHPAGPHDLLQVDFQPDHEQHEDQAEFGNDADRFLRLDPAHAEWTNDEPGDKVGEDQRLAEKMGQKADAPGEQDAKSDIANKLVHETSLPLAAT